MAVELYHWSPRRPIVNIPVLRNWSPQRTLMNFGDELGPIVVRGALKQLDLPSPEEAATNGRIVTIGSVMHLTRTGDYVWGTGINGKVANPVGVQPGEITITAVRGPRTWEMLTQRGFEVPRVFGDPAILLSAVDPRFRLHTLAKRRKIAVVPNLNDVPRYRRHPGFVSPLQDPVSVAREIAASEMVVGSSLHALILADVLGVPARWIESAAEHPFKYLDYYEGTGRMGVVPGADISDALRLGPVEETRAEPEPLLGAFPKRLFRDRP